MTVVATSPVSSPPRHIDRGSGGRSDHAKPQLQRFSDSPDGGDKNQDPTQPMDPSQMVSQLATVSEVGQAVQTNTTLASLLTTNSLSQAEQLIGQTITSSDGSTSGQVTSVSVTSTGAVATLANGATVSLANGANVQ